MLSPVKNVAKYRLIIMEIFVASSVLFQSLMKIEPFLGLLLPLTDRVCSEREREII